MRKPKPAKDLQGKFQAHLTSPGKIFASCVRGIFLDTSKYDFLKQEGQAMNVLTTGLK